ncbi:hypothetical protein A2572_04945 [Candidatus Collierbacteria bacterium RIFOXYD1_FULL_40_9]|uniref:Glycosyltransferase RgtA/B/C/D-like domain-containing protein n=1 Tax=Candidatus Collierbacteria bacterium RIFOXYD1_FULL_40_9 TaxID=1817731 RepID=A0A1F5FV14_9BACT|nr:MAG: hypothetical protein A2572_04945 [Candidatus Collierbacteria bacterium RIFOXYD1_FULL_40_9]
MTTRILIFLLGLLLCLFVYPSSFFYPKDTLPDNNDSRLIAYIIGQVQNNIIERKPLYQATFFAPEPNTLTYSDLFLTTSLLTLPARLFTHNPIFIFNLGFILNFALTFFSSFLFFQKISKNLFHSVIATLLFNLSSYHLHYYPHMQVFNFWIFFAAIHNITNYLESKNIKYLHLFLIFTSLQLAETIFTTYLLFFASLFFVIARFRHWRNQSNPEYPGSWIKSKMTSLSYQYYSVFLIYPTIWILLLLPYAKTHFLYPEASRSIRDAAHFSLGLDEYFTKYQSWTIIAVLIISSASSLSAFFEAIFCKVRRAWSPARAGVYALQTRKFTRRENLSVTTKRMQTRNSTDWKNIFWFSVIMSLGPVLKIFDHTIKIFDLPIPLPYTIFYYFFPGFAGFRTPSRFILLALFAASALIAIRISKQAHLLQTKTKVAISMLVLSLLALESRLPLIGYPININPPTVYDEVKGLPKNTVVLELPIKLWNMSDHQIESVRSLYSLNHKQKRLNGYSGFATLEWIKLIEEINAFGFTPEIKQKLKTRGVTHIVQNNHLSEI